MYNTGRGTIKCGIFNAYIFNQLYKYNFVKSKSFNLAKSEQELQNKVMHIVKSSSNAIIKSNGLEGEIPNLIFNKNRLEVSLDYISILTRSKILNERLKAFSENTRLGLDGSISMQIYPGKVIFVVTKLTVEGRYREDTTTVKELDSLINAIMYIPECIKGIAAEIDYIKKIDIDYIHTYEDIFCIYMHMNINRSYNPRIVDALIVLRWAKINHPEELLRKVDFLDEAVNKQIMNFLTDFYGYRDYESDLSSTLLCDKIFEFGATIGYIATENN